MKKLLLLVLVLGACREPEEAATESFGSKSRVFCTNAYAKGIALCMTKSVAYVCFVSEHQNMTYCIEAKNPMTVDLGADTDK